MSNREYVDFKKLKDRVSLRDVLAHYGLLDELKTKDENTLVGQCPITGSSSQTAFKARLDKNIWYSFVLDEDGAGGNILDFVSRMEDTDVLGAANLIAEWFPDDVEEDRGEETNTSDTADTNGTVSVYEAFETFFQDELDILVSGAEGAVRDALTGRFDGDEEDVAAVSEQLSSWIMQAYRTGYKLGQTQGRVDERISSLRE